MALSASTSAVTPASASAGKASGAVFVASFWSPTRGRHSGPAGTALDGSSATTSVVTFVSASAGEVSSVASLRLR